MGSVTAFIMIPFLAVFAFFGTIFSTITGADKVKVELPYDEEQGLVWTCEENADWFSVTDMKIKGDKQIFTVKGDNMFNTEYRDDYGREEVVFTAENNEQVTYIAVKYEGIYALNINHIVELYTPEEYGVITYTPKAETPVDGAVWYGGSDENFYDVEGADGETEFTLIYLPNYFLANLPEEQPDNFSEYLSAYYPFYLPPYLHGLAPGQKEDITFTTCLVYAVKGEYGVHEYHERILLDVELKDGEAKIINETRQYYVGGNEWTETKPATD